MSPIDISAPNAMPLLTEQEFLETLSEPMLRVAAGEEPLFDFWPYFESIPADHFDGYDCAEGRVEHAWRDSVGRYEHVLVSSDHPNVFMVLVLDRQARAVHGHRLLNLKREYGPE